MPSLHPDTLLQRAPDLRLQLCDDGSVEVIPPEGSPFHCSGHALGILELLEQRMTLQAALGILEPRAASPSDRAAFSGTISKLAERGALRAADDVGTRIRPGAGSFSGAPVHIRMLNDRVRTDRMLEAVRAVVKPGDVVVEVGTGTGVLAVAAAQAGARHVYAIEAGAMGPAAKAVFAANGASERITLVEGWSSSVTLPEKGDVFLSETIGNTGFDENLVEIVRDAMARHLRPGARMIPADLRLFALPVQAPDEWLAEQHFMPRHGRDWREWYGIDFSPLPALPVQFTADTTLGRPRAADWPALGAPVPIAEAGFSPVLTSKNESSSEFTATAAGRLNAFVIYFESQLAPGVSLSTDPRQAIAAFPESWANPVWLAPPKELRVGDRVGVDFGWNERGAHRWKITALASKADRSG